MNLSLSAVVLLLASFVLAIAAIKNRDPRDILREALNRPPVHGPITPPKAAPIAPMEPMQPSSNAGTIWTSV